jgi:uncharacterized protein
MSLPISFIMLTLGAAVAGGGEPDAEQIIRRATERSSLGFESGSADMRLVLKTKAGAQRTQTVSSKVRKDGGTSSIIVRFVEPPDVKGTTFLMLDRPEPKTDDMFLYLPELKRTRRISGSQRNAAFMGTDFSYADIENTDVKNATHQRQADQKIEGADCFQVVSTPRRGDSEYGRIEQTIRKDNYLALIVKYYGKNGELIKVFKAYDTKKVDGLWVILKSQMWSKKNGSSTFVVIDGVRPKEPVAEELFHPETLGR